MATTKKTETEENVTAAAAEERESIFIPRGSDLDDPNLFVSVNGVNYLLPKGQESVVPKHIAEEIRRGWRAQTALDRKSDAMLELAAKK